MDSDRRGANARDIERVFRAEHGRIVAGLIRRFGDIDLAEDALSDALVAAVHQWRVDGLPPNPGGWLTTTATRRAIDRLRRESSRDDRHARAHELIVSAEPHEPVGVVEDDRLRLIFICCHPALAIESRVALTLRLLGGLKVGEIARAFLVEERTMAQRLTRAKRKISKAGIAYRVPEREDLPERLTGVLAVLYLIFNEGYLSSGGEAPIRDNLSTEAIRLTRIVSALLPHEPEVTGLLALMLLIEARRPARLFEDTLVPLDEQDRTLWDRDLIEEGHRLVRVCLRIGRPGQYQLMAAINAVHTDARDVADTDWGQILALYDQLAAIRPAPLIRVNRTVAVAELDGPETALAHLDHLTQEHAQVASLHAFHVTRADLLRRLHRAEEAQHAYQRAIDSTDNTAERRFLRNRMRQLHG